MNLFRNVLLPFLRVEPLLADVPSDQVHLDEVLGRHAPPAASVPHHLAHDPVGHDSLGQQVLNVVGSTLTYGLELRARQAHFGQHAVLKDGPTQDAAARVYCQ